MPKTKILFISHSPFMYGAESCLATLVEHLDHDVFQPVVVLPDVGPLRERLSTAGVQTFMYRAVWWAKNEGRIALGESGDIARIQHLVDIVRQVKPDIIHSNTSVIWDGAVAARITGTRHVWHVHEILRGQPSITPILPLPLMYKVVELLSEKVVAVSGAVSGELAGFMDPAKLAVIHNGMDATGYGAPPSPELRKQLGIAQDAVLALTVASLKRGKGIETLIDAAAIVRELGYEVEFVIAGKGPPEIVAELQGKVAHHQLGEHVHFLGHRTDVPQLLAAADLLILPSLKEAFPMVIIEAMASGKPVIATDCGGPAEMVIPGKSGFIVPVENPGALAEKLVEMTAAPELMRAMGEHARNLFEQRYRAEAYARNFQALYREVLEGGQLAPIPDPVLFDAVLETYQNFSDNMRALFAKERELCDQRRTLGAQEQKIAEYNSALETVRQQVKQKDSLLAERDQKMAQISQWLSDRERDVRDHSRWLDEKNGIIVERDRLLAEWSRLGKALESQAVERDLEISRLKQRLAAREEELLTASKTHQLQTAKSEAEIVQLNERLAEAEKCIGQQAQELAHAAALRVAQDRNLQDMSKELATQKGALKHTQELLSEKKRKMDDHVSRLENELARLREEKEQERQRLQSVLDERSQELIALLNSRSWKVTAPLRKGLDILRKK